MGAVLAGKYRIDGVLGVGGMAVVYRATHRNLKQFAIKLLHPELAVSQDILRRFLREGYAANSLGHRGTVAVLDDNVTDDGAPFLVMELLEGIELGQLCAAQGGRLAPRAVLAIGHQLLDVLAAAHAKGVVHRDIKPSNLFITGEGDLKVLDFGIARVRDALTAGAQATRTGAVLGTPAFMAPEQAMARASEIDGQTDIWSAGATLFTCLSGHYVHEGENASQQMILAATVPARSLAARMPEVPQALAAIVDRALKFDKAARWPDAAAMRDAIASAHAALFGEAISRAPLATLVGERQAGQASAGDEPVLPMAPSLEGAAASAAGSMAGSVARPVWRDTPNGGGTPSRPSSPRRLAAAGMAIVFIALGAFELGGRWHTGPVTPMPSSAAVPLATIEPPPLASSVVLAGPPATPPSAAPSAATVAAARSVVAAASAPPRAQPAARTAAPAPKSAPCKLVESIDKSGETHFSCPCAACE